MSWMNQLYQTYEDNLVKSQNTDSPLTPIAHMYAKAQIEVMLNAEGGFISAREIDRKTENVETLIPVTEVSAGRSSGVAPHALSDTLSYLAGDFQNYCHGSSEKKKAEEKHTRYLHNLQKWSESDCSHPKVRAVFAYLKQGKLISDLIRAGIVELDENNVFSDKKVSGQPYEKAIVRFRILSGEDGSEDATWKDTDLIESYVSYYSRMQEGKEDICFLSGEKGVISENHPKGIIAADYGAKLVSANDNQGYTYRGRFLDSGQAYSLSYEASQKIHSALKWLAKNQGAQIGMQDKRTFICWNPSGKKTPDPFNLFRDEEEEEIETDRGYRKRLIRSFQGYRDQFTSSDGIIIMGLDAATTGRLSITYYHEFLASEFLDRIIQWGSSCNWQYLKYTEQKKPYYKTETPTFKKIVDCAFGREQGAYIQTDDKVLKEQTQRLLKCMLEGHPVPKDIMHALTLRASTPLAYSRGNREKVLSTACAVIKKYHIDRSMIKGEEEDMKLDYENSDRSYLFGRLLAIFEKVERVTYDPGENRDPNAIRLQSAYVNHPMQTWKILEDVLKPYYQKLRPGSREYYRSLVSKVTEQFREEDGPVMNQGLKETYLLGYYLQRAELKKKTNRRRNKK